VKLGKVGSEETGKRSRTKEEEEEEFGVDVRELRL
tara:strand:- start:118 stop:222 length:105 start_codon:yes stop_codon:yes gene_type:complete